MTRRQRLIIAFITYIPVLILIVTDIIYVKTQVNRVIQHMNIITANELERRLNRKVSIGRMRIATPGVVVFEDVKIANGAAFETGVLAVARQIVVRYDLRALLNGKGASSVSRITISGVKGLLIRRRNGSFNISDLFVTPPGPRRPPFKGLILISNADITFKDYSTGKTGIPTVIKLHDLSAAVDAAKYPVYSFNGYTHGTAGQFRTAGFTGRYFTRTKEIKLDLNTRGVSAAYLSRYASLGNNAQVLSGNLDMILGIDARHVGKHYSMNILGTAQVSNAVVRLSIFRSPVTGINGRVVFTGKRAAANLNAALRGSIIHITGLINDFKSPQFNFIVSSRNIDFSDLVGTAPFLRSIIQFHPTGRGSITAKVTGIVSNPVVEVVAGIPQVVIRGVQARNVQVSVEYRKGFVTLRSLQFVAKGTIIRSSGTVAISAVTKIALRGSFRNMNLAMVLPKTPFPITGTASGTVTITGPTANPRIIANAIVMHGSINGFTFNSAVGKFEITGQKVNIENLVVSGAAGGVVRLSGTATQSALNLNVIADGINLARVGSVLNKSGYEGMVYFKGHVTGSVSNPNITGSMEAFNIKSNEYTADYALIDFTANKSAIHIPNAIIRLFPAEIRIAADITGINTNKAVFSGNASVQRLSVQKLLGAMDRKLEITGTIVGDVAFSGAYIVRVQPEQSHFRDITASGNIGLEDATAFGYPVNTASAKLNYANDVLTVNESSITSESAQLTLNGSLDTAARQIYVDFNMNGFDLARIRNLVDEYIIVGGTLSANGSIKGSLDNPTASVSASVTGLMVNYERFDQASVKFDYADDKLTSYSALLTRGDQSFNLQGTDYDFNTNCLASVSGNLKNLSVPDLWDIFRGSPYISKAEKESAQNTIEKIPKLTSGVLNGSFTLTGCISSLNGAVKLNATDVGIDVQQIQSITLDASVMNGTVTLNEFRASSGEMSVSAIGKPFYENGVIKADLTAQNLDLSRLRPWLGENAPGGILSAYFEVRGSIEAPDIMGSIEVVKPSLRNVVLDRFRASTIQITPNRIELPEIILSSGDHQAVAQGYLPWDWSTLSIPSNEPLEVTARMNRQNLNILSVFVPLVDATKTTGTVEAQMSVSGTILDLQLGGSMTVANGIIALTNFTNTFNNVTADMAFNGDRLVINQLSADSSDGGTIYAAPGGYVALGIAGAGEANVQLVSNGLVIGENNLLGYQENVNTQVDAGLLISGNVLHPIISDSTAGGKTPGVTLSHTKLSFAIPQAPPARTVLALPINPSFNISIRLGQDVVVSPPNMTLVTTGNGTLTGSIANPKLLLNLIVDSGTISLATVRLRLVSGGTISVTYAPPAQPDATVDLQASTSVVAVNSFNQRERYQITMNITGSAVNPQINLSSSPPGLTREQMLAALGHLPGIFTSAEAGLQQELTTVLSAVGTSAVFAPIENLFVQRFGFEQFSLEYAPTYPLAIYISRKLFGNYYIAFSRLLMGGLASSDESTYQVVLSYRLSNIYQFSAGVDNEQTTTFQVNYSRLFR